MNMEFLYLSPRWEGSVADSNVFESVWSQDSKIPNGHYYLANARYGNSGALLVLIVVSDII